jgi:hypothetical protein
VSGQSGRLPHQRPDRSPGRMSSRRRSGPGRTTCPLVETLVCMVRQSYCGFWSDLKDVRQASDTRILGLGLVILGAYLFLCSRSKLDSVNVNVTREVSPDDSPNGYAFLHVRPWNASRNTKAPVSHSGAFAKVVWTPPANFYDKRGTGCVKNKM